MEGDWQPEAAGEIRWEVTARVQVWQEGKCWKAFPANIAQKAKEGWRVERTVGKEACPGNQGQGGGKDTFRLLNVVV